MSLKAPVSLPTTDRDFQRWCRETFELRRTGVATPVGVVVPKYIGEEFLNTTGPTWYKSTGLTNTNWVALN
jgi:hypothetical protein